MAKTMRAAVVRAFGKPLAIEEVAIPTPGPGEVLVKIVATGVCHTDLHAADGDWPVKPNPPFSPGHEGAGKLPFFHSVLPSVTRERGRDERRRGSGARDQAGPVLPPETQDMRRRTSGVKQKVVCFNYTTIGRM